MSSVQHNKEWYVLYRSTLQVVGIFMWRTCMNDDIF
jgi:hypothetical protein